MQPFRTRYLNNLNIVWISASILALLSSIVFQSDLEPVEEDVFASVVIVMIVFSIGYTLYVAVKDFNLGNKINRYQKSVKRTAFDVQQEEEEMIKRMYPESQGHVRKFYQFLPWELQYEFITVLKKQYEISGDFEIEDAMYSPSMELGLATSGVHSAHDFDRMITEKLAMPVQDPGHIDD